MIDPMAHAVLLPSARIFLVELEVWMEDMKHDFGAVVQRSLNRSPICLTHRVSLHRALHNNWRNQPALTSSAVIGTLIEAFKKK